MGVVNLPVRNTVDRLGIRVTCYELAIRDYVKQAGGIWRPRQQLWELNLWPDIDARARRPDSSSAK